MRPMVYAPGMQVYAAPLQGGGRAVVLFNRHHPEYKFNDVTVTWPMLGYVGCEDAVVRNLYKRSDLGTHAGEQQLCSPHIHAHCRIGAGSEAKRPALSACTFAAVCVACVISGVLCDPCRRLHGECRGARRCGAEHHAGQCVGSARGLAPLGRIQRHGRRPLAQRAQAQQARNKTWQESSAV